MPALKGASVRHAASQRIFIDGLLIFFVVAVPCADPFSVKPEEAIKLISTQIKEQYVQWLSRVRLVSPSATLKCLLQTNGLY